MPSSFWETHWLASPLWCVIRSFDRYWIFRRNWCDAEFWKDFLADSVAVVCVAVHSSFSSQPFCSLRWNGRHTRHINRLKWCNVTSDKTSINPRILHFNRVNPGPILNHWNLYTVPFNPFRSTFLLPQSTCSFSSGSFIISLIPSSVASLISLPVHV